MSRVAFATLSALLIVALYNGSFWARTFSAVMGPVWDAAFLLSLLVVLVVVHSTILLLIPTARLLKLVVACSAIVGAVGAYFSNTYGVGVDADMIRNVVQTDPREAAALLNMRLVAYVVLLGFLPAALVVRIPVKPAGWRAWLGHAAVFILLSAAVCSASLFGLGAHYASFLREHKAVRYLVTPANLFYGAAVQLTRATATARPAVIADLESPVTHALPGSTGKPLVMFLVIGETARAANFQLGGYLRATNPGLAQRGVDYFPHAWSCGTSTAVSLPCMFSGIDRTSFEVARADRQTNLLDALMKAGVSVEWRDNNSGCKGVCARVPSVADYHSAEKARLCSAGGCYDEVMLEDVPRRLTEITKDTVIVFHQAGSHGPAYSDRYPAAHEVFRPACQGNDLSRCTSEQVVNAYDNSVRYTDSLLSRQIDMLRAAHGSVDGILVYVSDHGESLGENGLYLHGAPYVVAPDEQKRVPLLFWMSPEYRRRFGISAACMDETRKHAVSHQHLYHTVLGAMAVRSARYHPDLDILARCRAPAGATDDLISMK